MMLRKLINKVNLPVWLIIVLCLVLILRIPSFFEPYFYGDEMIYLTIGNAIRQGIPLYKGIYDNKPPLLYIIAGIAGNLFWFKAILAFWSISTVALFYNLSKTLFPKKENLQKISTIILALLTTLPFLEGNIANAELFMIAPTILAITIIFSKRENFKNLYLAGVLFSIAALFKIPAFFEMPVIIVYWFFQTDLKKEKLGDFIRKTLYFISGFLSPFIILSVWFFLKGSLTDFIKAAFLQNFGYLSSFRPSDIQKPFLVRNFPLFLRGLLVLLTSLLLFIKRGSLKKEFIFICLWIIFGLFAVTLSERPYPHYLIQVVPAASLLFGLLFTDNSIGQSLSILPLGLMLFIPVYYHYYHYPTFSYLQRFVKFASGSLSKKEYLLSFDKNTIRNYEVANFITTSTAKKDNIYLIGDGTSIYALSRRLPPGKFVADYHILDYSSMQNEAKILEKNKPKFIIIVPSRANISNFIPLIRNSYLLISEIDGVEIWKLSLTKP